MSSNLVPAKAHAELGASSAHRWMACPGSVRMSRGIPNIETEYAREGTAAHALAELCLRNGTQPHWYSGMTLEGVEVTDDMASFVGVFVDYCRGLMRGDNYVIEHRFSLAELNPPGPMFGTSDFVAYDPDARTLEVVDLKYGQGVLVEVTGNPQLRYYALGALLEFDRKWPVKKAKLTIIQPRMLHPDGVIRSEVIDAAELLDFSGELFAAARTTMEPDAPLAAGEHCRFCPAAAICPAQLAQAQALAQIEFATLEPIEIEQRLPAPETLTREELGDLLDKIPYLEDWFKAIRAYAQSELEHGRPVPGQKLVAKRATRKWASEEQVRRWLEGRGYDPEEFETRKLKSPAQIERLMGRAKKELPAEFIVKESSGYVLASESDPREAVVLHPGEEFLALPGGSEE